MELTHIPKDPGSARKDPSIVRSPPVPNPAATSATSVVQQGVRQPVSTVNISTSSAADPAETNVDTSLVDMQPEDGGVDVNVLAPVLDNNQDNIGLEDSVDQEEVPLPVMPDPAGDEQVKLTTIGDDQHMIFLGHVNDLKKQYVANYGVGGHERSKKSHVAEQLKIYNALDNKVTASSNIVELKKGT